MLDFDRTISYTLYAWVKPTSTNFGAIMSKMQNGGNYRGWDMFSNNNFGGHLINNWSSNAIKETSQQIYGTNLWKQVAITYDGSSSALGYKLFVDGVEAATNQNNDSLTATTTNNNRFTIGSRDGSSYFTGYIDEVKVSNISRTNDWIKLEYENQKENHNFVHVVPAVVEVTSTNANGNYKIGDIINVRVKYNANVNVDTNSGTPYIELETGNNDSSALYKEKINAKTLMFEYNVIEGDLTSDLSYKAIDSLIINGGTIVADDGFKSEVVLPPLDEINSLGISKNIVIDGIKPVINSF